jgi:multidrug resistance efflux pump
MKSSRIVLINILVIVALIIIGGVAAYYWNQNTNYVVSQDASVTADTVPVVATASGTLQGLNLAVGQRVNRGQVLATETVAAPASAAAPAPGGKTTSPAPSGPSTVAIVAPVDGTVASVNAANGQTVAAGTPIATLVELRTVQIVANIPETKIHQVAVGQTVDVTVDAQPGVTFHGTVAAIQPATQSFFSLIPTTATAGSYTKVIQRVPVIINIETAGYTLLPGENAEVRIHLTG